ncbi:MAG: hypothetical protein H7840_18050 [Alphaproteobacteria bacterium]
MKRNRRRGAAAVPQMMVEMTLSAWETIARRSWMMASGACPPAEYRRMVREKADAAADTARRLAFPRSNVTVGALLAPWHKRVTANAKRLRRKRT